MPTISIHDSTFKRLQSLAIPFVDISPDMVIRRALDALDPERENVDSTASFPKARRVLIGQGLPDMTHTKILSARVADQNIKANWNSLVSYLVILAKKRLGKFESLRKHYPANLVRGRKEDEGYRYLHEIDVSVQGMCANDACRALVELARSIHVDLDITFMWRDKEGALKPGVRERIQV